MPRPRDWYPDTDPKALGVFIELQRKMTPAENARFSCAFAAHDPDRETMLRVYGWYPPVDWDLHESTKMLVETRFVVHCKSGETEIVHALQAIQDDEPSGYLVFVDAEGVMKALFHKPIVDCWEESPEA
jgi:hypothetical protein